MVTRFKVDWFQIVQRDAAVIRSPLEEEFSFSVWDRYQSSVYEGDLKRFLPSLRETRDKRHLDREIGHELVSPSHFCEAFLIAAHGSMD